MTLGNTSMQQPDELLRRYGPWALVTGASSGIGREFAVRLAEKGFSIVLCARRRGELEQLASELSSRFGARTQIEVIDLSSAGAGSELAGRVRGMGVGVLVCAAGFGTSGRFVKGDLKSELEMVDVNCRSVAELVWHVGGEMSLRRRGAIVLLSSLVGFQGVPRAANYAATKAYVQSLAEGLRVELAEDGVDVIACAPGPIRSGFAARAGMVMGLSQGPGAVAGATLRALRSRRGTVRPGAVSKLLGWSLSTLPRFARVMVLTRIMGQMTRGRD
ncbi:MAG: SDR family NAD(P)-dependent oxidoreductase [Phycisphaerales bacterium]|nr:SDR family NAD(P)-dependent oxidoreductase [Phycisphaerales bacterium]